MFLVVAGTLQAPSYMNPLQNAPVPKAYLQTMLLDSSVEKLVIVPERFDLPKYANVFKDFRQNYLLTWAVNTALIVGIVKINRTGTLF